MSTKQTIIGWLVYLLAIGLRASYRIRVEGLEHRRAAEALHPKGSFCLALWHEHLFGAILGHANQRFAPLASLSKDGDLVTFVMSKIGFKTVRGSSSRRGEEARHELVQMTDDGWFTAITVDGPRGPRRQVKGGIVDVARRTGVAILPVAVIADRTWQLRSWDEFKVPKPFARVILQYGPPFTVAADTQGLAFGAAKMSVKSGLESAEAVARRVLAPGAS